MKLHKNDPGAYVVVVYSRLQRKHGVTTRPNLTAAQAVGKRWARMTGGSAVISRVIWNSALPRPTYPEALQ